MARTRQAHRFGRAVMFLPALAGCSSDQEIQEIPFDFVGVTTGDFDKVEEALDRNGVPSELYEGYIFTSVYDEDVDPLSFGLQAEDLFLGEDADGEPALYQYPGVFINSGTRGFGAYVYNGVEADDSLVTDDEVIARVLEYLERRRTLIVSDWAYDLVEAAWPEQVQFLNEEEGLDAAQVGYSDSVIADVVDADLAELLGNDQLEVFYDFSFWTVIEDVGPGTKVHLRGDIEYRAGDGEGYSTIEDIPLLVSFDTGRGRVIFSSFAWRAQRSVVTDQILAHLIDGLDPPEEVASDE